MTRHFKVMERPGKRTASDGGAELRFRGQWLRAAGFEPGSKVVAVVRKGYIELAVQAERLPDPAFVAAMAGLSRVTAQAS